MDHTGAGSSFTRWLRWPAVGTFAGWADGARCSERLVGDVRLFRTGAGGGERTVDLRHAATPADPHSRRSQTHQPALDYRRRHHPAHHQHHRAAGVRHSYRTRHAAVAGRRRATIAHPGHRPSMVVGGALPGKRRGNGQPVHSAGRPTGRRRSHQRRRDSLVLGAAPGRQAGHGSRPDEHPTPAGIADRRVPRAVLGILRQPARPYDSARGGFGIRGVCGLDRKPYRPPTPTTDRPRRPDFQ